MPGHTDHIRTDLSTIRFELYCSYFNENFHRDIIEPGGSLLKQINKFEFE